MLHLVFIGEVTIAGNPFRKCHGGFCLAYRSIIAKSWWLVIGQPKLGEVLDTGVCRLHKLGKFRQWAMTADGEPFESARLLW